MRLLAVSINGILDLKNFFPLSMELKTSYGITLDVVTYSPSLVDRVSDYDGLVVGSDWNQNNAIVSAFNAAGRATILVQSEGMFLDRKNWYVGRVPEAQSACLWGEIHAEIFRERGYKGNIVVTGPPRFDIYGGFRPSLSREEVFNRLNVENSFKPYILFLGQFFPEGEFGPELLSVQKRLTEFACTLPDTHLAFFKSHPQEDVRRYFSRQDIVKSSGARNVTVIDDAGHKEAVELTTLLAHAAGVVSFSSTALVEAVMLGVPAFVFEAGLSSPLADGRTTRLPRVRDAASLLQALETPVDADSVADFVKRYLPGRVDGSFTRRTAAAIAATLEGRRRAPPPAREALSPGDTRTVLLRAYTEAAELNSLVAKEPFLKWLALRSERFLDDEKRMRLKSEYYQQLHEDNTGYKINNWLVSEIGSMGLDPTWSVVELGCGNGEFLRRVAASVAKVHGLDWARSPRLSDLPPNAAFTQLDIVGGVPPKGDLACSADVLEHFSPTVVDEVIAKLLVCAPRQYHVIACYSDGHSHLTVTDPGSWLAIFRRHSDRFRLSDVRFRRGDPSQPVCVLRNY